MPDHLFRPGERVVGYLRDSGHEKQELSVAQQERAMLQFCAEHGLVLERIYTDAARQGSRDENRECLAEMMNDLRHGLAVAGVLVWSNARLARNSVHAQFYRAEIRKMGYRYHSLIDRTVDGPEAIIFEALIDYKNERYLVDMSLEVRRGLRELVQLHGCVPGAAPTGFVRVPVEIGLHRDGQPRRAHRWEIDPALVDRIRPAVEMRAAGASLAEIHRATGHLLGSLNSYRTFFSNKIYIGILEFGDDLVVENYCPPIVPIDTWQRVQEIQGQFARRKNMTDPDKAALHPRRVGSKYLLTGLATCGRCGSPLFGRSHIQRSGAVSVSYYCSRAYNKRDCTKTRIPGATLQDAVIDAVSKRLAEPDYIAVAGAELDKMTAGQSAALKREMRAKNKQLGEIRRQITNTVNAIARARESRALTAKLADLELRELELINDLTDLERQAADGVRHLGPVELAAMAAMFGQITAADPALQRSILHQFVQGVTVERDGRRLFGTITIYYPPGDMGELNAKSPGENSRGNAVRMTRRPRRDSNPRSRP